ncbi:hydroxyisourate hydrolase [Microbulbifer bruguierae]|uniref:5-hydroxyisourate hydrolase n=1 Tax=Microbulbifer bruguierae TaxID=3029061 RepID=A0ABY8N9K4_9GAMM|nr:hydroxyisourate hydrolase [Microbulbifer bruguierae]WGL15170.1 hydroxyisourate hydrolase [Microbulbifer bruguierae]
MSQITTHVLDTACGRPAAGIAIALAQRDGDRWLTLDESVTNQDGRAPALSRELFLRAGIYRLRFTTASYLEEIHRSAFYPHVDVVFALDDSGQHYHIPLLLSPFGYSTYRGS